MARVATRVYLKENANFQLLTTHSFALGRLERQERMENDLKVSAS